MEWSYSQFYKIETHKHPDTREDNVYIYQNTGWGNLILFFSPTCLRSKCGSFIYFFLSHLNDQWRKKKTLKLNKNLLACALKLGRIDLFFFSFFFKIWFWLSIVLRRVRIRQQKKKNVRLVQDSSLFSNRHLRLSMNMASNEIGSSEERRQSVSAALPSWNAVKIPLR